MRKMREIRKILIANRGEIAVRVIRAARELGIKTVSMYSEADKDSMHRYLADEAYLLKGYEARETYLNIEKIISIAKKSGADAIHPGYGFLSQNPAFVRRVEEEGIIFIGPPARVHEFAGNKVGARKALHEKGFPVVPGSFEPLREAEEAVEVAEEIGYPVILKPVLGGGGVGMKICLDERDLLENFNLLQKLAISAFGSEEMYIEKYYEPVRHIEVQVLGDLKGNVIHLFERECSIQRRFQKIVEEAPSPALDEEKREAITRTAVGIAKAIGYSSAGTVEFIYIPSEEKFYFIELNSRIQVEHPVTEMITGIDIVKEQIVIAENGEISIDQDEIFLRGHAFEARIYAEDPSKNFAPAPGRIVSFIPPYGIGVRVDTACYPGCEIPPFYDPMIAKLIVWGRYREEALRRMLGALDEFTIIGVPTNIPLHKVIFEDKDFKAGNYDTKFIERKGLIEKGYQYKPLLEKIAQKPPTEKTVTEKVPISSAWKVSSRIIHTGLG